jgi:2Fe-2S ferredoxin
MATTSPITITFEDTGLVVTTSVGRTFMEICDEFNTPVLMGCRSASCGTCLIRITSGGEKLSPPTESEAIMLDVLADGDLQARLACQCSVYGSIVVGSF